MTHIRLNNRLHSTTCCSPSLNSQVLQWTYHCHRHHHQYTAFGAFSAAIPC